jgi:hypothetical protein
MNVRRRESWSNVSKRWVSASACSGAARVINAYPERSSND